MHLFIWEIIRMVIQKKMHIMKEKQRIIANNLYVCVCVLVSYNKENLIFLLLLRDLSI